MRFLHRDELGVVRPGENLFSFSRKFIDIGDDAVIFQRLQQFLRTQNPQLRVSVVSGVQKVLIVSELFVHSGVHQVDLLFVQIVCGTVVKVIVRQMSDSVLHSPIKGIPFDIIIAQSIAVTRAVSAFNGDIPFGAHEPGFLKVAVTKIHVGIIASPITLHQLFQSGDIILYATILAVQLVSQLLLFVHLVFDNDIVHLADKTVSEFMISVAVQQCLAKISRTAYIIIYAFARAVSFQYIEHFLAHHGSTLFLLLFFPSLVRLTLPTLDYLLRLCSR